MGEFSRDLQSLKCSFSEMNSSSSSNLSDNQQRALLLENFMGLSNHDINPPEILAFSNLNHNHHRHLQEQKIPLNFADVNNSCSNNNSIQSFVEVSPPALASTTSSENMIKSYGGRKRKRKDEQKDTERPKEVIHVRAKRGQATDSHSLAERVRREKINEKLRCLQDLVPGCYKTMGMAVMLDVIINYVQSLQNQIEFLSMKLSAASMYHDFNMEMDDLEAVQGTNAYEVQEMAMERMAREGCGGPSNYCHPTWPL